MNEHHYFSCLWWWFVHVNRINLGIVKIKADPVSLDFDFIWQYRKSVKPDGGVRNYLIHLRLLRLMGSMCLLLEHLLNFGTGCLSLFLVSTWRKGMYTYISINWLMQWQTRNVTHSLFFLSLIFERYAKYRKYWNQSL